MHKWSANLSPKTNLMKYFNCFISHTGMNTMSEEENLVDLYEEYMEEYAYFGEYDEELHGEPFEPFFNNHQLD